MKRDKKQKKTQETVLKDLLHSVALKATPERVEILRVLEKHSTPLTIHDLKQMLSKANIDQATVYRTIEHFREKGLVSLVNYEHDHIHFEFVRQDSHHHHVICQTCGFAKDITVCEIDDISQKVKKFSGFSEVYRHSLEFFGMCMQCAHKKQRSS